MLAQAPGRPQRRRSQRQGLRVPMELFLDGRPLRVETRVVSESGALVLSPRELPVGTQLEAINLRSRQRAHVRVAWLGPRESASDCQLGLELNEPSRKFWGRAYSPAPR